MLSFDRRNLHETTLICRLPICPIPWRRTQGLSQDFRPISTSRIFQWIHSHHGHMTKVQLTRVVQVPVFWTLEAQTISRSSQSQVGNWSPCSPYVPGVWTENLRLTRAIYNAFNTALIHLYIYIYFFFLVRCVRISLHTY